MIISLEHKYIYIAVPKTATTSVQEFLLKNDPTATKDVVEIEGKRYKFKGHMTADTICDILGKHADKFTIFGFIRSPLSRLVSGYHFYKMGAKEKHARPSQKNGFLPRFRIKLAQVLPFKLYVLIYPYKSNVEYFYDKNGKLIVKHIGIFEDLKDDLSVILGKLKVNSDTSALPFNNVSKHDETEKYFKQKWFVKLLKALHPQLKKDWDFYEKYSKKAIISK